MKRVAQVAGPDDALVPAWRCGQYSSISTPNAGRRPMARAMAEVACRQPPGSTNAGGPGEATKAEDNGAASQKEGANADHREGKMRTWSGQRSQYRAARTPGK